MSSSLCIANRPTILQDQFNIILNWIKELPEEIDFLDFINKLFYIMYMINNEGLWQKV
jgi:hypothetical protein